MKKLLYSAAVLALAFFAGSCQRENLEPVAANGTVTYTVQVPGAIATKADDGVNNVDRLVYEVYRTAGEKVTAFSDADNCLYHREAEVKNGKAEIALEFVNDQNFTVLFWAYDSSTNVYNVDNLTNVTVASTAAANTHETAAFTGVDFVVNCVSEQGGNVTLTRPVAQLNIATTPESLEMDDTDITVSESYVKVYGLSTSFNVAKQEAGEATGDVTYTQAAVLGGTVKVGSKEYPNLAMNYLGFIPAEGASVKVDYLLKTSEGNIDNTIENVPVKPNYRTNIVGNLISGTQDYNVTLDAEWDGVAEEVEVWDGKFLSQPAFDDATSTWSVKKASELAWLAAAVNGEVAVTRAATKETFKDQTFVLTADIDLGNYPWTPIGLTGDEGGFQGTFDGQGHTISNLYVDLTAEPKYQSAGLFGSARYATIKNFTIKNATVKNLDVAGNSSNGAAVVVGSAQFPLTISNVTVKNVVVEGNRRVAGIAGYFAGTIENCTVENATITAIPDLLASGKYDNGDKVGGIIGYANGKVVLTGNTVKNFTIKGYRDAGGVAGYATDAANNISGNTVIDGSVILDRDYDYCEEKGLTAGAVVGYGTPGENTVTNVAVANTDEDVETPQSFAEALANVADGGVVAVAGEISATSLDAAGKNITIVGTTEDATIDASSQVRAATTKGNITFKNLTFKFSPANEHYNSGFDADNGTLVFENCKFEGLATADGSIIYNNCQFTNTTEGKYAAWVYAGNVVYNNCSFKGVDRAVKVYGGSSLIKATYNDCTFEAAKENDPADPNKAGVEVTVKDYTSTLAVDINNPTIINTASAEHYGNEYFNIEAAPNKGNGIVTLDGHTYAQLADGTALSQVLKMESKSVTANLQNDVAVTAETYQNVDFTLDGNGHTISQAEGSTNTYALFDSVTGKLTLKNVKFTGIKGGAVLRTIGAETTLENVTIEGAETTQVQGLLRLVGKSTIKNCIFKNNTCSMVITHNYDTGNQNPQVVENCLFEGNTCNSTAVLYYVKGESATINGNKFIGNTVNCKDNGATVYMGFTENNVVTNNLFQNNTVNEAGTSSRVAGGVFFGYETEFTGNAFIGNSVTGTNAKGNDVCVSTYYTDIDLSGNYWGGNAPVVDVNYFQQHKDMGHEVVINDYLTANPIL